ncbi:Panacea domain-containing protein [Rathayibacter rathayi]|uniref:Antitoxin SocA-like Panacea domain-containing protein n=1 Tax=Rathayibacter rathayi TaxID=33887 RepID=A0ABX5AGX8_RATRA|nr:type II toxin-antitoxin system antitoxin SocA domain-containing protein [Rathayibacter rathayi]PPF24274.1 hypothetical protein C5C34_05955 [Rathayibacter rathayi]PPF51595.1 hypothetical protein C5C08_01945 [Rathayibacter rathayi]PPF83186.1 hypothetical protein C5C14_01985 [Rathayibacter rathayi]PPG47016.1 hypothetical protein C5C20_01940 [Rathayibacter rathayi]PPG96523.1 hypothetical protein C5C22_02585 [Rathayibacter rathayi]
MDARVTVSASHLANSFLRRAFADDVPTTPMTLQRLLYVSASEYGKRTDDELLGEAFLAWLYGPVQRGVYDQFRGYRSQPVRAYAKDARGTAFAVHERSHPVLRTVLTDVWSAATMLPDGMLACALRAPDSAWSTTPQGTRIPAAALHGDVSYRQLLNL